MWKIFVSIILILCLLSPVYGAKKKKPKYSNQPIMIDTKVMESHNALYQKNAIEVLNPKYKYHEDPRITNDMIAFMDSFNYARRFKWGK